MTLIETMTVITIYTILMLAISFTVIELYQTNAYSIAQADEVDNARRGVLAWNRDTKEMTVAENGNYPLDLVESHRFGYYSDTDLDNSVEYVEYELASTTLTKYTYDPSGSPATYDLSSPDNTETLSLFVQNIVQGTPTFQYFDNSGTELTGSFSILDVKYIRMQLIVNIDPVRSPGEFMLRSSVAPRNLKDNL